MPLNCICLTNISNKDKKTIQANKNAQSYSISKREKQQIFISVWHLPLRKKNKQLMIIKIAAVASLINRPVFHHHYELCVFLNYQGIVKVLFQKSAKNPVTLSPKQIKCLV